MISASEGIKRLGVTAIEEKTENCPEHGNYLSTLTSYKARESWSRCGKCVTAEIQAESRAQVVAMFADAKARKIVRNRQRAELPGNLADITLDDYIAATPQQARALEIARRYAAAFSESIVKNGTPLVFVGGCGTGKTHLAVAIASAILPSGLTAFYIEARELVRKVQESKSFTSLTTESLVMAEIKAYDLLILDEIGANRGTDSEVGILGDVIASRHKAKKPIIAISNLTADELKAEIGDRAFDRLRDYSGVIYPFTWESHRGKRA